MGPETTSESNFAFEAFMPLGLIALLGVLLLGICWWMARRDRPFRRSPEAGLAARRVAHLRDR
jgi:hypothetical protein